MASWTFALFALFTLSQKTDTVVITLEMTAIQEPENTQSLSKRKPFILGESLISETRAEMFKHSKNSATAPTQSLR